MDRRQISVSKRPTARRPPRATPEIYWLGLVGFVVLCLIAASLALSFASPGLRQWYPSLSKPALTPAAATFAPVWFALYLMMAVAAWRVWVERRAQMRRAALILFVAQLALSVGWPLVFFMMRSPGMAAVEILILWSTVLATTAMFFGVSRIAALLLTPWLLWSTVAAFLNIAIWRLN